MAPTSVFLSSGSPTRRRSMRAHSLRTTSSATLSCSSSREPAQQTWPWLKKMPSMMPSTAWSSAASSNTMLADLPPSSSVRPVPVPAERVLELVRPAGVGEEVRGGERDVDVARLPDRLAAVERLDDRELARPLLDQPRDAEQVLAALERGQLLPRPGRGAGRL